MPYIRPVANPFFSVVMQSYLGDYGGMWGRAASDRRTKFRRAIESLRAQTFTDWELIVVADGCDDTWGEREWIMAQDNTARVVHMPKQRLWSEHCRNLGIAKSIGQWILYLDTDDTFDARHLQWIAEGLAYAEGTMWAHFDDWVWSAGGNSWQRRESRIEKRGGAGTSNIVHRPTIAWPVIAFRHPHYGYDHDWQFIQHLKAHGVGPKLGLAGYRVHHIPRQYDI